MNKKQWKAFWRLSRIARREQRLAFTDMMIMGMGVVRVDMQTLEAQHIPFKDFVVLDLPQVMP